MFGILIWFVLGEFIVARWSCCVMWYFVIHRKFVGKKWHLCRFLLPMRAVKCCLPCYWRSVVVFVGFDFGMCCWLWYFEVLLFGLLHVRCSGMVWFAFRLACEIVWNIWACLLGEWCSPGSDVFCWTLLLREIQENLYILIVM